MERSLRSIVDVRITGGSAGTSVNNPKSVYFSSPGATVTLAVFARPSQLEAIVAESELKTLPTAPTAGSNIKVTYKPSPTFFANEDSLVLRARFR